MNMQFVIHALRTEKSLQTILVIDSNPTSGCGNDDAVFSRRHHVAVSEPTQVLDRTKRSGGGLFDGGKYIGIMNSGWTDMGGQWHG
ncbi:hypothetical protein D9M71_421520 [compost metagenome]